MKTPIDRRTAIAATIAASTIAVSPRLFALDDAANAELANVERQVPTLGDPSQRRLVGDWRISRQDEVFEISLQWDEKFTMKCFSLPKVEAGKGEFKWAGKGDWSVRDDSLLLHRTHKWMWVGWAEAASTLYNWCPVINITPTKIILANDVKLERLKGLGVTPIA